MYYIQHIHYIKMKCQMLPFHPKSRTRSAFHSHHFHSTLHQEEKAKEVCKAKTLPQNTRAICPPPCAGVGTAGVKAMVCKVLTVKPNCASHVFFTISHLQKRKTKCHPHLQLLLQHQLVNSYDAGHTDGIRPQRFKGAVSDKTRQPSVQMPPYSWEV